MKQEYLIKAEETKAKIEAYKYPDEITLKIDKYGETEYWVVVIASVKENLTIAKKLSEIDQFIQEMDPILLTSDCSEFYNEKLYPIFNRFERKLRKLLRLASAFSPANSLEETITKLEKMDFGQLFDALFIDDHFNDEAKKCLKGFDHKFSKEELLERLSNLQEISGWDELLGREEFPELRKSYTKIRDYRNDTMHAHNINYKTYMETKSLLEEVIKEIDDKSRQFIKSPESFESINESFNQVLMKLIQQSYINVQTEGLMNALGRLSDAQKSISGVTEDAKNEAAFQVYLDCLINRISEMNNAEPEH